MHKNETLALEYLHYRQHIKMAQAHKQGRAGALDASTSRQHLSNLLREAVEKGDPVDVANYCAFLLARGEEIAPPMQGPAPAKRHPLEVYAEAYETMARASDNGDVSCASVATDIRQNMMPVTRGL